MTTRLSFKQISALVLTRARKLAEDPSGLLSYLTKDSRKALLATMHEVETLWKQGKPVQRRAQTVLQPQMWHAHTGIEPEKLDIGSASDISDLMQPGFTPQWEQLINIAAASVLGSIQTHGSGLGYEQFMASLQLPFSALYIYMCARRFGTPSVFELRDNLAEKLILTDTDQIRPDEVRLPLPGFYVQMPPSALELWNKQTGWHKVSFVGIAESVVQEGPRMGRGLTTLFWCEPSEKSTSATDDNAQVSFISLPEGYEGSIEKYETAIRDDDAFSPSGLTRQAFCRWQGQDLSFTEGHRLLRRFAINFCLYLSSPNPDVQPTGGKQTWHEVIEKAEAAHGAGPHAKRQVTVGKNFSLWEVGRNVRRLQKLTATDILVRGHWRSQAHGTGRLLRRRMWIEPFVRRATGEDVPGHEYAVHGERDIKANPDMRELAMRIAQRLRPAVGSDLAAEVANGVAQVYVDDAADESISDVVRSVLEQRLRHRAAYRAEALTREEVEAAVSSVEDMEP